MKRYYFSRFSHTLANETIVAYYHSLRMVPVYVSHATHKWLEDHRVRGGEQDYIEVNLTDSVRQNDLGPALEQLVQSKILSAESGRDDDVLSVFRRSLRPPYIKTAFLLVTDHCNFGCAYCYLEKEIEQRGRAKTMMSPETAVQAARFFARLTKLDPRRFDEEKQVVFYGGEPLMNMKVVEVILREIKALQQEGQLTLNLKLNMISNGSLLNSKMIRLLKEHQVGLSISLDGDETATNSSRCYANGKPVYQDIRRGMDLCHREDYPFGLSVTLTEASLDNPESTANTVFETGAVSLGLNPILQTNDDNVVPDDYARRAADFIIESYQLYRRKGISEDRMMRKALAFARSKVYPFDCNAAGGNQIIVTPDGTVGICQGMMYTGKTVVTDVFDDSFDPGADPQYLEWSRRSPLNMEACESCMALGICGGGCPFVAEYKEGTIWGMDRQFCVHAQRSLEWLIFDLYEQSTSMS